MKKISRVINLLPCSNLDDFPTHHQSGDAQSLLANWTAAWHPELIAATGSRPVWCSTDQTDPNIAIDHDFEHEDEETDPYYCDLYPDDQDNASGDHNGPHAPQPYDGSPFRLPHQTDDELNNPADGLWQDSVILIPTVATASLHEGFAASAAATTAAMVAGQTDRQEIANLLATKLELRTDEATNTWANEFYALGYAWLQVQLLTRKIRYSSNLNQTRFDSALIESARAVVEKDYDRAESELTTCYDTLMEEKNNYYPVKPDLIDLVLTSPKTLGKSFTNEIGNKHPSNFHMTGHTIETLAKRNPETTQLLQQRLADQSAALIGGVQLELPAPLLSKDSEVNQIVQGRQTANELLGATPSVYLRRRAGLTSDLPLLLEQLDYNGALHASFDRARVPPSSSGSIQWSGPGSSSIMAQSDPPLDASDAATFLDFAVQFGKQIDSAHSAMMLLVHWPGKTASAFEDLVRVATRSEVLGTFRTLDNHFDEIYDPGYGDRFLADEYRPGYLEEAVRNDALAPISSISSYWSRTWRLNLLAHLNTWIAMASHMADDSDQATATTCESIASRIQEVQSALEQDTESWQPPTPDIDAQIVEIEDSATRLFRQAYSAQSESEQSPEQSVLINPLSFRRRLPASTQATNNSGKATKFTDSQKPFQLSVIDSEQTGRQWVMDVDSFCAVPVEPLPTATTSDGKRVPDVVSENKLQNEFFVATIDPKSGGLRSIQFHGKRGNRGGQRIVYHDHKRPSISSQMVCRSTKSYPISKLGGLITTEGSILMEGQEVADFIQRFRLMRGQRYLQLEIELTPKISLPSSTATWFASQLAWQEESCTLHAACQLTKYDVVEPQIQSPSFVEISMSDYSLTLLAGGLPFHRRTERCKLDTMLIVGQEQQREFKLGIGVNISHAARAACHLDSPPYVIMQLPRSDKENTFHRCLVHLDCKNIITTFSAPVYSNGDLVAVRLRLQETEGRGGRLNVSTALKLKKVIRQNLVGHPDAELTIDSNLQRFGVDFSAHDFIQIEIQF